jgi:ribosomal protein S18 acetylase RimI-like enzyme
MQPPARTIRPLTAADEPVLWIMLYLAVHVPEGDPTPPLNIVFLPGLARYARGWGRPNDLGLAAYDDVGLPVGAAWLRLMAGEERGYGWVSDQIPELSIAVIPEQRGRGLGSCLLQHTLDAAAERFSAVSLSVSRDNPATRLYQRMGFRTVWEEGGSLTMLCELAQPEP